MAAFVEIAQLGKTYETPSGPSVIVRDFTLYVNEGEFVCLLGASGCGKSTLLSLIASLDQITGGRAAIHVITGGDDADQLRDGDRGEHLPHRVRRERSVLRVEPVAFAVGVAVDVVHEDLVAVRDEDDAGEPVGVGRFLHLRADDGRVSVADATDFVSFHAVRMEIVSAQSRSP